VVTAPEQQLIVGEQAYPIRRLSIKDVFWVARIMTVALSRGGQAANISSPEDFVTVMIASVPLAEDEIVGFCSSIIGVSTAEFLELPPEALLDLLEILYDSQDLKRFLERCLKLIGKAPATVESNEASI
jgi:hypothetical protein